MCFIISLFPATFWAIVGYFVLFSSTKAEGPAKTLGQALAIWVFVIVGFILMAGAYISTTEFCSIDTMMECAGRGGP